MNGGTVRDHRGDEVDVMRCRWRVGRKVGRTIYAQFGPEPSDDDRLIGVMDTPLYASVVVLSHNAAREQGLSAAPLAGQHTTDEEGR